MALKHPHKPFKFSFMEDDVYFYEQELDAAAEEALNKADFSDPLWHLDPSDEDNGLLKLGDFIPPKKRGPSGNFGAQQAA